MKTYKLISHKIKNRSSSIIFTGTKEGCLRHIKSLCKDYNWRSNRVTLGENRVIYRCFDRSNGITMILEIEVV